MVYLVVLIKLYGNMKKKKYIFTIDQGLFCHDQVSLGKFLAFFNL